MVEVEVLRDVTGPVVIRLSGDFDGRTAAQLEHALRQVSGAGEVVLDFSHVRSFDGVGMAAVAGGLLRRGALRVRGMVLHHRRLLRYCGVHVAGAGELGG